MLVIYAIGKVTNGFLADRANIRRFMATGLLVSAVANLAFGLGQGFVLFALLWGVSGWFQSIGSAPSVVAISQWFSRKERGTRYGVWSTCHSIGEGLTFVGTAVLVSALGWRSGFWGPGLVCVLAALVLYRTLADRPETMGLPHVEVYMGGEAPVKEARAARGVARSQLEVLRNPAIWLLGLAAASIYVARYGMNNWGVLYLQEGRGYDLTTAGAVMGACPVMGMLGAASSGWISDRFFGSGRSLPALLFGLAEIGALAALFLLPPGQRWLDTAVLAVFGYAMGGLLVFLGGLMAVDVSPQNAAGAAMGVIGMFSYLGAAVQDAVSGWLLDAFAVAGARNFAPLGLFWVGASVLSLALAAGAWRRGGPAR
jgi:OPA family sugar phosphate sensor protein UhpC-like MFS transporter